MDNYLIFGAGFYIGAALSQWQSLSGADVASILRGLVLGVLLWPIAILLMLLNIYLTLKKR